MKLDEAITIAAPPETVWALMADPALWPEWNPKIVRVDRHRSGVVVVSEEFGAVFALGSRQSDSRVAVRQCEPPHRFSFRQTYASRRRARFVEVSFGAEQVPGGTRVTHHVDLSGSGIPWWLQCLLVWVHRTGRSRGTSPLENLKRLAEKPPPVLRKAG